MHRSRRGNDERHFGGAQRVAAFVCTGKRPVLGVFASVLLFLLSSLYCFDPHVTVEARIPEGFVCAQISRISHDAFRSLNSHSCEWLSAGSERLYQEKGMGCKKMEASLALGLIL